MTGPAAVLVVNFNGAKHLPACLAALEAQTAPRHTFEVVVVDNASRDESVRLVRDRFPWVRLVPLSKNVGFAEGNNVAARYARGSHVVLLNNDTIPDPFWLEELFRAADENPGAAVASKLVFAHDPTLINSGGLHLLRDGRGADLGFRQHDDGRFEAGGEVFAGCGAALLLPTPPVGEPLLDPRYFMYSEDLDLGWRRQLRGQRCVLAPRSLVRHVVGASAGETTPLFRYYVERNRALTAVRNGDPFLAGFSLLVLAAKLPQALLRRRWRDARAIAAAGVSVLCHLPAVLTERYDVRRAGPCGCC